MRRKFQKVSIQRLSKALPPAESFFLLQASTIADLQDCEFDKEGGDHDEEQIYEFFSRFDGPRDAAREAFCMLSAFISKSEALMALWSGLPGNRSKTLSRKYWMR